MPDSPHTLFLAGGGTGGHLYPGIAVAEAMRHLVPDVKPVFLCTNREIDRVILESTGFEFIPQPVLPLPSVTNVGGLLKFWKSWRETKDLVRGIFKQRRPVAVLGLGGYAAGVAVRVAAQRKIPTSVLNPDVIPGKANKYLMQHVGAICCQFDVTADYVSGSERNKLHVTGCPIRTDIRELPAREAATSAFGLDPMLHTLVVTGASLGAHRERGCARRC